MTSARRVARNTGVHVGAEIVSKAATLALYAVMARKIGQEGFGEFSYAFALAALLIAFAGPGTNDVLTREVARELGRLRQLFWVAVAIKTVLGALAVLVAVAVTVVGDYPAEVSAAVALLGLSTLLEVIGKSIHATFAGLEDLAPVAASLLVQRLSTALVGILVLALGGGLVAISLVFAAGSAVGLCYAAWLLARRSGLPGVKLTAPATRWLLVTALPLGISSVFTMVLFRVDTVILSMLDSESAVGLYSAAYRVLDATLFISFSFVTAMVPVLSRLRRDGDPPLVRAYSSALKASVAMLFPLGTAFALFAEPIMRLLYGASFAEGATALRLLGGTAALFGVSYLTTATLISQDRQAWVPWVTGTLAVFNVALNFILIPSFSLEGAALATTATEAARAGVLLLLVRRLVGPLPVARVVLGPVLGCLAMVAAWAALGERLVAIGVAAAAYSVTLLALEHRLYPRDLRLIRDALARRRSPVA